MVASNIEPPFAAGKIRTDETEMSLASDSLVPFQTCRCTTLVSLRAARGQAQIQPTDPAE